MASNLGTVFVELSLDDKIYRQKLSETLTSTQTTAKGAETAWKALGVKSDAVFESQARAAQNAYTLIKNAASSTANDIMRAEEAKNAKIKSINEQQFGHQTSLVDKMKANWIAATVAIGAAMAVMYKAWNLAEKAAQFEEMEAGLEGLSSKFGMTAASVIEMAKAAVDGQLSMMEAGKLAAKAFALGLNPDQVKTFLVQAERLTDVMGGEIPEAFEAMERAAATGRSRGLVQYGINVDLKKSLEDYAKANDIAKESISTTTAMQIRSEAIMKAVAKVTDQLGEATESTADKMGKMRATLADTQLYMGQFVLRGAAAMIGVFQGIAAAAMAVAGGVMKIGQGFTWVMSKISGGVWTEWYEEMKVSSEAAWETSKDLTSKSTASLQAAFADRKVIAMATKQLIEDETEKTEKSAKVKKEILAGLTAANKAYYDAQIAASDHWVRMQAIGGNADIALTVEVINKKLEYLEEWNTKQRAAITANIESESERNAKLLAQDKDYSNQKIKINYDRIETTAKQTKKESDDSIAAMEKEIELGVKLSAESIKRIKERGDAARDLYKDMRGYEGEYYNESIKLIEDQAGRYRNAGLDEVAITKWVADEYEKAEIEKLKASGKFFNGISAGLKETKREQMTWSKAGVEIVKEMSKAMASNFSTFFEDVYQGKMKDLGDYAKGIWDTVRRKYFDIVAQIAAEEIMAGFTLSWVGEAWKSVANVLGKVMGWAVDWFMGLYDGGLVKAYAGGGPVEGYAKYSGDHPGNDTVIARLSPGEYVMPRSAVNERTRPYLDYMRDSGRLPGYAAGGEVLADHPGYNYLDARPLGYGEYAYSPFNFDNYFSIPTTLYTPQELVEARANPPIYLQSDYDFLNAKLGAGYSEGPGESLFSQIMKMVTLAAPVVMVSYATAGLGTVPAMLAGAAVGAGVGMTQVKGSDLSPILYGAAAGALSGYLAGSSMAPTTGAGQFTAAELALAVDAGYTSTELAAMGWTAAEIKGAMGYALAMSTPSEILAMVESGLITASDASAYAIKEGGLSGLYTALMNTADPAYWTTLWNVLEPMVVDTLVGQARGKLASAALNTIVSGDTGYPTASFEGMSGGESLKLIPTMNGIIGMEGAFSARDGLDYVPYDNFPARLHKAERVLTADQNKNYSEKGGSGGAEQPPVQVNWQVDGRTLASIIYKQTKSGVKVIHSRGVTDV
jgi:hypothetical protein